MKRNFWLSFSVALNVALAGAWLWASAFHRAPQQKPIAQEHATVVAGTPSIHEPNLASQKPQQWFETLRGAAVPEKLIAAVAVASFETDWQQRRDELQRQFKNGDIDGEAMKLFHLQHDAEEEKALRTALGDEGFRRWDQERLLKEYHVPGVNLSARETDGLYALRKEMEQKRHELAFAIAKGDIDETAFEKQTEEAQKQFEQNSRAMLGDERYAIVANTDGSTGDLKRVLASMNSTPTQAEAVLQTEQQWNEQRAKLEKQLHEGQVTAAEYEQQMQALNTTRDNEYQHQLGTNGLAALEKAQDNRYRLMQHFASAWSLDEGAINNLYAGIQNYENSSRTYLEQARALQEQGQAVDWPAVQAALQQYCQATEDTFRKSLGDERFNKLKRNHVLTFSE
jgi:hypothetical protein